MSLDDLNMSELVLVAQDFDEGAHRGMSRGELLEIIEAGGDSNLPMRKVDKVRLRIMQYIIENWNQVSYQISCPAKSQHPRACFSCLDLQVSECAIRNRKVIFPPKQSKE